MRDLFQANNPATKSVQILGSVISIVGKPCSLAPVLEFPLELEAGQTYEGWQVPFTIASDLHTIFRIFGLWQSSNGLMMEGKKFTSLRRSVASATTLHPILVGDFLDGRQVVLAENSYSDRSQLWSVRVQHGSVPAAIEVDPTTYRYYASLLQSDQSISEELITLVDNLFTQVLPLVMTVDGKALNIAGAQALFNQMKNQATQKIEKALQEQEDSQWHL